MLRWTAGAWFAGALLVLGVHGQDEVPFAPKTRYDPAHSFRGLAENNLTIANYEVSGHATTVSGVHDYFRLVGTSPSSYGAVFSSKPVEYDEWVAEFAFRVHGHHFTGLSEENSQSFDKGGRGLAFWFTKTSNPTEITISNDPHRQIAIQPPIVPNYPVDPTDKDVSLFGYKTSFDGLGVIFDTSPQHPLVRRSSAENWEKQRGARSAGVVAGILDDNDGTSKWIDPDGRDMAEADEAIYLDKAIGECEAAFRNADGLLWARVSYVKGTIRVDLDLSPHTTLSPQGRHFAHNCFSLSGVKLEKGHYVGLTALAAGNPEPDSVDIYAMDFFEVLDAQEPVTLLDSAPEDLHLLEGTQESESSTFAHEIFLSQARLIEAVDALARRVEGGSSSGDSTMGALSATGIIDRLNRLESKISSIGAGSPAAGGANTSPESKRLLAEFQGADRKLDNLMSQLGALTTQMSSRNSETGRQYVELVQRLDKIEQRLSGSTRKTNASAQYSIYAAFAVVGAVLGSLVRSRGRSWDRSKKMI